MGAASRPPPPKSPSTGTNLPPLSPSWSPTSWLPPPAMCSARRVPDSQAASMVEARSGAAVIQSPAMPMECEADQTKSAPSGDSQRLIGRAAPQSCSFVSTTLRWRTPRSKSSALSTASSINEVTSSFFGKFGSCSCGTLCFFPNCAELSAVHASVPFVAPSPWRANLAVFDDNQRNVEWLSTMAASKFVGMTPAGTSNNKE
mmetsp:Transcript_69191/g.200400  ORF Transcript_69191/g.200400 Transcript_69191/m.200400 type:complete len:202 (-) Transcript_69191:720-1325(-)